MSQQFDTGCVPMIADEAIPKYSRVILESDGRCVVASLTEIGDGIAQDAAFAAGDQISVKLWNSAGTFKMIASEAVAVGATLYTESNGEVQDTAAGTSFKFAKALEAATGDQSIIECALLHAAGVTAES